VASKSVRTFFTCFSKSKKNMTFYVFWVVAHVFSNRDSRTWSSTVQLVKKEFRCDFEICYDKEWLAHTSTHTCTVSRGFFCARTRQRVIVSSVTTLKLTDQTTTRNNFSGRAETWCSGEWRRRRRSFAGRLCFWPITCQYKNVFTPRLTRISADIDYRP